MALSHRITIFFLFIAVYLAKSQNHEDRFYFKPHNYKSIFEIANEYKIPISPSNPFQNSTTSQNPTIPPTKEFSPNPCIHHSHVFSFSNVGLQKIGRDFINSDDIINLYLDNNEITDISPFAFRNIRNLRYLDLSGNKIPKEKLLSLSGNDNLWVLIINNNRNFYNKDQYPMTTDTNILKEYEVFLNLKYLHLCNSQLGNFQVPFYVAMPTLTHLYLCNNSINSTDVVFDNIPATLTNLYINQNFIDRVKQDKLRHLQELIMDDNIITQVCFEECEDKSISLKGALKLQNLTLSNNLISEITPDAFSDTSRLLMLDLSGNKIADVAKGTFNNTNMMSNLSLAHNRFATVPDVCSMYHLKILNLSENRISAILSGTFCSYLRTLEYLYLSNNVITTIETRAFYNLQRLKYLDLSGNRLRQLPAHWGHSLFIEELHLERNNFTDLDNIALNNIKELRNIYLDENPMSILKAGSFHSLPGHLKVYLKNMRVEDKCTQCQCDNDEDEDEDDKNEDEDDDKQHNNYSWNSYN